MLTPLTSHAEIGPYSDVVVTGLLVHALIASPMFVSVNESPSRRNRAVPVPVTELINTPICFCEEEKSRVVHARVVADVHDADMHESASVKYEVGVAANKTP